MVNPLGFFVCKRSYHGHNIHEQHVYVKRVYAVRVYRVDFCVVMQIANSQCRHQKLHNGFFAVVKQRVVDLADIPLADEAVDDGARWFYIFFYVLCK